MNLFRLAGACLLAGLPCLPALALPNPNGVAVIVGNRDYTGVDVPGVTFAIADADAMKAYVVDTLGYPAANVIDLRNATQGQLNTVFGTAANPRGRLSDFVSGVGPGRAEVVVFFSGHGVPSLADHSRYLLPVEGDPSRADLSGYSVDLLQDNLAKLGAKSVTVYLDACFTGASAGGQLVKGVSGTLQVTARDVPAVTLLAATRADQVASWDIAGKHGLFTEYLLQALSGGADAAPYGNDDRTVSAAEVDRYLTATMTTKARQLYGRDQNMTLSGAPEAVLAALPPKPVGPAIEPFDGQLFANANANVRVGPDAATALLGTLSRGTGVAVTGKAGAWYRVELADGKVGYVLGTVLDAKAAPAPAPAIDPTQIELAFWTSIQNSQNPADFEAYLRQYPKGAFVALANIRVADLSRQAAATARAADDAAWAAIQNATDTARFADYLQRFPQGAHAAEAEAHQRDLALLVARTEDEDAWNRVRYSTVPGDLDTYLAKFPAGQHVDEARARQKEVAAAAERARPAVVTTNQAPVAAPTQVATLGLQQTSEALMAKAKYKFALDGWFLLDVPTVKDGTTTVAGGIGSPYAEYRYQLKDGNGNAGSLSYLIFTGSSGSWTQHKSQLLAANEFVRLLPSMAGKITYRDVKTVSTSLSTAYYGIVRIGTGPLCGYFEVQPTPTQTVNGQLCASSSSSDSQLEASLLRLLKGLKIRT